MNPQLAAGDAGSRTRLIDALRQQVAQGSGGRLTAQEIREDAQLFDRGYLDSFSYVEFLAFIEQSYGVRIEDSQLAGHLNTIAAMAAHILQEQASATD
jgi:acyl carrier protein